MPSSISVTEKFSLEQAFMHSLMTETQKERLEGWDSELVTRFPPLTEIKTSTILGMFSWSSRPIMHRWLKESDAVNYGGGWVTPGDLARDYLAIKYKDRRIRITTRQYNACVKDVRQPPLLSIPCTLENAVYIDLKGAYWSIVRAVGWDVSYCPERYLANNSSVEDFPYYFNKMARNCLVSVGLPGSMRIWTGEKLEFIKKPNRFINMVLWRLVQDVLNGVAYELAALGAVYIYTDGYILPADLTDEAFKVIGEWGLECGIKHEGKCTVNAPATYEFPGYKTKVRPRHKPISMSKIYNPNIDWLKWRFAKFAKSIDYLNEIRGI